MQSERNNCHSRPGTIVREFSYLEIYGVEDYLGGYKQGWCLNGWYALVKITIPCITVLTLWLQIEIIGVCISF